MSSKLSFSYSKMGMYKECPQKYKFRYIDRIPEKPKYYFAFGTALHKVMEYIYSKGGVFPPLEETKKIFTNDWRATTFEDKGYASKEKEEEGYFEGLRIIDAYYQKHAADIFSAPLATEFRTTVDIDGLSVISILDRVDYLGQGKVSILDYKTGKTLKREPDQLMMYQKLMTGNKQLLNIVQQKDPAAKDIEIGNMLFYHLPSLKEQAFEPASTEEINDFWQGVLKVAADIMGGNFGPDPGETKCRWCDYKHLCPVWNLQGADDMPPADENYFKSAPVPAPKEEEKKELSPMELLAQKIDALGAAQEEAAKLKAEIIKIMQDNNFVTHFGSKYSATMQNIEVLDFADRQKTVDVLRELNLLPKVLVPTLSSIKNLLEKGNLTAAQKQKLEALSTKTKQVELTCKKADE